MRFRLHVGTKSLLHDSTTPVEFNATMKGKRNIGISDEEVLYRVEDSRLVVYTKTYSKDTRETTHSLHLVTKDDLDVGGKFELLGRECGICKPLTLDEALGIEKEPELEWSIWYVRCNRFLIRSGTLADFKNKPDRYDVDRHIKHPVFFSKEKAELCLAEWVEYVESELTSGKSDEYVVMPYWKKWYTVEYDGIISDYVVGNARTDEENGFPADAYHGTVPLFKTIESADRWLDDVDRHHQNFWRGKQHVIAEYTP